MISWNLSISALNIVDLYMMMLHDLLEKWTFSGIFGYEISWNLSNFIVSNVVKLSYIFLAKQENSEVYTNVPAKTHVFKLSYIFLAKQEISEAYTNIPAKTHVNYFISMFVHLFVCRSVAHFCVRLFERTIKASDFRFAAKCRH